MEPSWRHPSNTYQATWAPSTRTSAKRSKTSLHAFQHAQASPSLVSTSACQLFGLARATGRFAVGHDLCESLCDARVSETEDFVKEAGWDAKVTGVVNAERGEVFL